jgi:hypothetical protein
MQLIDYAGTVLSTYYHPGHLYLYGQLDLDNDGEESLVIFGENSTARFVERLVPFETERHCGFVSIMTLDQISGQAFPYSEPDSLQRDWPELPKAREQAYVAIPPIHPDWDAAVIQIDCSPQADGTTHVTVRTNDNRMVYFDHELRPYDCWLPEGTAADSLRDAAVARFPPMAYVRDGHVEFISVPVR